MNFILRLSYGKRHLLTYTKTTVVGTTKMDAKQKAKQPLCIPSAAGSDTRCPDPGFKKAMKLILEQSRQITQKYQLVTITFKVRLSLK